jgi:hypothetical protein
MSIADRDESLLSNGFELQGGTFADTLAFNGQCFLLSSAKQLRSVPEQVNWSALAQSPPSGRVPAAEATAWEQTIKATGRAGIADPASASGFKTGGESDDSAFGPILMFRGKNGEQAEAFNKMIPNTCASNILMNMEPAELSQLVPYIKLYKVEYGRKENPYDPDNPLPDTSKTKDIEIKFDRTGPANADSILESTGRLGGIGIKKFSWQLKGVNPAEADKNIEAQLDIHFNNVDLLFRDQYGDPALAVESGYASPMSLIVWSSPIKPRETVKAPSTPAANPDPVGHLMYDGKFFEVKAVVGWDASPEFESTWKKRFTSAGCAKQDMSVYLDKLKTILYLQLVTHQFSFNQDGSADLTINYRARSTLKELGDDVTGTARREFLLDRVSAMTEAADTPALLKKAKEELDEYKKDRYSNIVKRLPTYIAWATPEQVGLFDKESDSEIKRTSATDLLSSMTTADFPAGLTRETDTGIGIAGLDQRENYLHSSVKPMDINMDGTVSDTDIETFFKLVAVEPMHNPYGPGHGGRANPAAWNALPNTWDEAGLNDDPATYDDDEYQESLLTETNSSLLLQKNLKSFVSGDTLRKKHIPVVFFYLGDLIWSVISGTPGTRESIENKDTGIGAFQISLPDPAAFYKALDLGPGGPTSGPGKMFARKIEFGRASLTKAEIDKLFYDINIAALPIQFDLFLQWLQQKIVKSGRDYYFFESFLVDLIRELVNPILGRVHRCLPGIPDLGLSVSYVPITINKDSVFVKNNLPWKPKTQDSHTDDINILLAPHDPGVSGGGDLSSNSGRAFGGLTRPGSGRSGGSAIGGARAKFVDVEALSNTDLEFTPSILNKVSTVPNPDPENPGTIVKFSDADFEPGAHITIKVLMSANRYISRAGSEGPDEDNSIWHFRVGSKKGPLKNVAFDRVDVPMMREARVNKTATAAAWQLRELYNATVKLVGFPGIIPGQTIFITPNLHMFGDPADANSFARILGIGGYHLVISTDSELSPAGYSTTVRALHEALPKLEES